MTSCEGTETLVVDIGIFASQVSGDDFLRRNGNASRFGARFREQLSLEMTSCEGTETLGKSR
jgi:hypothetical protein